MEGFVRFFSETAVKIKMLNVEKLSEIRTRSQRDARKYHEMRENHFIVKIFFFNTDNYSICVK